MKLIALITLVADKEIAPGETFDIDAKEGKGLVTRGFAAEPAAKAKDAAKAPPAPPAPPAGGDGADGAGTGTGEVGGTEGAGA